MTALLRYALIIVWFVALNIVTWLLGTRLAAWAGLDPLVARLIIVAPLVLASLGAFYFASRLQPSTVGKDFNDALMAAIMTALFVSMQVDPASWEASWSSNFWLKARLLLPYIAATVVLTPLFSKLGRMAKNA